MPLALLPLVLVLAAQAKELAGECDALLARHARAGWSGAALVARGGEVVLARGYGPGDLQGQRTNEATTLFEIASLSKQFTAAAVLKLEQQGKLELDDSIAKLLPGVPAHSKAITIHHLLTHTSGVPRENASGRGEDLEAAVRGYLGTGPRGKPGQRFEYWNGGYALLAGIVERASGKGFTEYCESELFAPAGLADTGFTGDADLPAGRAAIGRSGSGAPRSALEHPYGSFGYQYRGMGGVVTTVLDLWKWERALEGTSVLGAPARKRLFTPLEGGYACGWYVTTAEGGGERHSHGGSVRGFVCEMRCIPSDGVAVIVLSNTDEVHAWELADNLESLLFGRPLRHAVPESVELAPEVLAACAGIYEAKGGRLVVRVESGVLVAGIEGQGLLDALAPSRPDGWKGDLGKLGAEAVALVEAIARGDVEPLRKRMAKRIPVHWPDSVRDQIYPLHVAEHGRLASVRALGARYTGERVAIVLALENETSPSRVEIAFSAAGLERLAWDGPEFAATLRLLPQGGTSFELVPEGGKTRAFEFVRKDGRITALKTSGLELARRE
jgi:CubicO group peptidase (beta-lactamase class C family)